MALRIDQNVRKIQTQSYESSPVGGEVCEPASEGKTEGTNEIGRVLAVNRRVVGWNFIGLRIDPGKRATVQRATWT